MPVWSFIKHFRPEFEHYVRYGRSMVDAPAIKGAA
jgi:NADH-quinone oxidoreductase subunit F